MELTKDANLLACCMYKEYLERRKNGIPKRKAIYFKPDSKKNDVRVASWIQDDYFYTLGELRRAGLVRTDLDNAAILTDKFIVYMENRFKDGIQDVLSFLSTFFPIITNL